MLTDFQKQTILSEATLKTSRSGGKGGQNVNKVASKVELVFEIETSSAFDAEQKQLLLVTLANKLDLAGMLHVISQEDRSQLMNREQAAGKLFSLLEKGLHVPKKRRATKIPKAVVRKRLEEKASVSVKKSSRKKPDLRRGMD